jgi:hypothetical protein
LTRVVDRLTPLAEHRAAPRPPLLVQGIASAAVAGALLGLEVLGDVPLLAGVAVLQVLGMLAFLALAEAPDALGIFAVGVGATIAADVVVTVDDGKVGGLAGVVALSLVAGLLHQLTRHHRGRVTEALADTFVVVVVVCSVASLAAATRLDGGSWPLRIGLAAAGAALLAGRLVDTVLRRPSLAAGATRAWPGLLVGLGGAVATAVLVAGDHLTGSRAALVGLAAGATVCAVDLAVDLAAGELTPDQQDGRRVDALRPVALLLPFALLGPVLLLAVHLLADVA